MTSFYGEYREKNIINDEEENRVSRANVDKWIFRLLLLLVGFMPLIVLADTEAIISPIITDIPSLSSGIKGDLFTSFKSILVLIITISAGLLLLAKVFFMNGSIKKTKLNYFLGGMGLIIVLSTIFSPNISIALNGQYNRSDGALTWLCYIALVFISMNIEHPKKAINFIVYSFYPFIIINFIIITMNFFGNDVLQYNWVRNLITLLLQDGQSIGEGSTLLGTLNHGNYMSGMFAIITMMILTWVVIDDKLSRKIINSIIALISIHVVFMSLSTSGFLTILCITPFLLWLLLRSKQKLISTVLLIAIIVIAGFGLHTLAQKNPKTWDETFGFFVSTNPYKEDTETVSTLTKYNMVNPLKIGLTASAAEQAIELPNIPETGVGAGSGRIYIWSYVLDLVKERPLVGYGLDSLMYNFPHFNIDARANLETENVIVDKPHNMYVGILYGTGIIGFIIFMIIIVFTLWKTLKEVVTYKASSNMSVVLGMAWLAFLFQAIFNDSLPGLAAPLWVVLGVLLGNSQKEKINEKLNY